MIPDTQGLADEERLVAYYIVAAAALEGLPLEPAWRAGVAAHFTALHAAALKVMAVPLDDHVEAAPIFAP